MQVSKQVGRYFNFNKLARPTRRQSLSSNFFINTSHLFAIQKPSQTPYLFSGVSGDPVDSPGPATARRSHGARLHIITPRRDTFVTGVGGGGGGRTAVESLVRESVAVSMASADPSNYPNTGCTAPGSRSRTGSLGTEQELGARSWEEELGAGAGLDPWGTEQEPGAGAGMDPWGRSRSWELEPDWILGDGAGAGSQSRTGSLGTEQEPGAGAGLDPWGRSRSWEPEPDWILGDGAGAGSRSQTGSLGTEQEPGAGAGLDPWGRSRSREPEPDWILGDGAGAGSRSRTGSLADWAERDVGRPCCDRYGRAVLFVHIHIPQPVASQMLCTRLPSFPSPFVLSLSRLRLVSAPPPSSLISVSVPNASLCRRCPAIRLPRQLYSRLLLSHSLPLQWKRAIYEK